MADGTYIAAKGRPKRHFVDPDWLRRVYHEEKRPVGEIASEIGCSLEHLKRLVVAAGIPARDGRWGCKRPTRRAHFDIDEAKRLYEKHLWPCDRIADVMGVHATTVHRSLRAFGVRMRHHNDTKRGAPSPLRIELDARAVTSAYLRPGASVKSVGKAFGVSAQVVRRILGESGVAIKASSEWSDRHGRNNGNWKPSLTDEERQKRRDSYRHTKWRETVYERDGYRCQKCGFDKGKRLNAHHIVGYADNPQLRWNTDNGITLCGPCHREFHRRFGLKDFGAMELQAFLSEVAVK